MVVNFYMPTRLFTGDECISKNRDALEALGASCVVVTEAAAGLASGALGDVDEALRSSDIRSIVWDGVTANPPVADCAKAGRLAAKQGVSFVLGVGGGSSLDAAKAVAVFAANPLLDEDEFYAKKWTNEPLPIALVGTTAGTGSEVTKVSVLTDSASRKHSIHDDRLYAAVSFGDSRYTHSCPASVTTSCGVDVLAHAIESYFSNKADEVSRAFAVRAVQLAIGPLVEASAEGSLSAELRAQLYEASILGGLAINTTGTCFPHNVGYYLTENYGVPHGFACAVFLPEMLRIVQEYDPAYAEAFYSEVGATAATVGEVIVSSLPSYDIRMTDQEIAAALPRWENNGSVMNTRADVTTDAIRNMLHNMFVK